MNVERPGSGPGPGASPKRHGYAIEHYGAQHRDGVAAALASLLGDDLQANAAYLDWKYERNPHARERLGVVALHRGEVVGFRGYAASLWRAGDGDTVAILMPGDTCVAPAHRNAGLSVAMGQRAAADYAGRYSLLLNLSCTRASLPGYLKLGFAPITNKIYLSSYGLPGLARYLLEAKKRRSLDTANVALGASQGVAVSAAPRPDLMAAIADRQRRDPGRLRLVQDADWFRWRFAAPAARFLFYYLERGAETAAYLVLSVAPCNRRAYIVDYAGDDDRSAGELIGKLLARRDFDLVSIFAHSVDDSIAGALASNGFRAGGIVGALEKRVRGNLPLLVRPVAARPGEDDWRIQGRDVRDASCWAIRGICSDAA